MTSLTELLSVDGWTFNSKSSAEHKVLGLKSAKLSNNDPASETIESNQHHRNQHPNVRISVAESASKTILDQHAMVGAVGTVWTVWMVGMVEMVETRVS